jgi:hypothetical protein
VELKSHSLDAAGHGAGDGDVLAGGKYSIQALAAVLLIAGRQHALASEPHAGGPPVRAEYFEVAANCDVVICSYVTKTVICHRLNRACAYQPPPRPSQPQRRRSHVHSSRDFF